MERQDLEEGALLAAALLGVRLGLSADGRHPALIARDFTPPFDDRLAEAIVLCHALWRDGEAESEGPHFPVEHAVNLPRPAGAGSPLIALDLTGGEKLPGLLAGAADLLLHPSDDAAVCRVERT